MTGGASDGPSLPRVDPRGASVSADVITPETLAAFLVEGDEQLAAWALRVALTGRPRAEVYDTLVRDAMVIIGRNWESGRWTISEEHLGSVTLTRALAELTPAPLSGDRAGPLAVLAATAGEEHAIALILFDHVLQEVGWSVADLGANVPLEDLVRYVTRTAARLVALSAARRDRMDALAATVAALRAIPDPPAIMIGGRILGGSDPTAIVPGADWSGTSLRQARHFAADLLARLPGDPLQD
jgi:methanogenic corrinoid protein MtbC1